MATKKHPADNHQQGITTKQPHDKKNSNVIISDFAPGFNDHIAKNIITNLYQIYFREKGIEGVTINVYNKEGELIT